jgi:hypothetical protein
MTAVLTVLVIILALFCLGLWARLDRVARQQDADANALYHEIETLKRRVGALTAKQKSNRQ